MPKTGSQQALQKCMAFRCSDPVDKRLTTAFIASGVWIATRSCVLVHSVNLLLYNRSQQQLSRQIYRCRMRFGLHHSFRGKNSRHCLHIRTVRQSSVEATIWSKHSSSSKTTSACDLKFTIAAGVRIPTIACSNAHWVNHLVNSLIQQKTLEQRRC